MILLNSQMKSSLLALIPVPSMIDASDCQDRGFWPISGRSRGSIRLFLLYPTVCSIFQDWSKDCSSLQERDDGHCIVVKSSFLSVCNEKCDREKRIEVLLNLRYPCISEVIGVVLPSQRNMVKIVGMCFGDNSLSRVVLNSRLWSTPTAKAKAMADLVFDLRFAHSFRILHGHLTGNNMFLNEDRYRIDDGTEGAIAGFSREITHQKQTSEHLQDFFQRLWSGLQQSRAAAFQGFRHLYGR
jgi:hypothetical protein